VQLNLDGSFWKTEFCSSSVLRFRVAYARFVQNATLVRGAAKVKEHKSTRIALVVDGVNLTHPSLSHAVFL